MRLFEAIVEANHRALAGDAGAGLHPGEFADALPIAALTCIDARLNPLFPEVLGLPKEHFIWLRNAGNIITGTASSTMRSLALACAIKGGKEIAIIGHTDCLVGKTSTMQLMEAFRKVGVERAGLPENLTEFFGVFASERQNVIKGVDFARRSPLIGPKIPVHGLMVDTATGKLEWVVNGYQALEMAASTRAPSGNLADDLPDAMKSMAAFNIGEMKFPETKIGEIATESKEWLSRAFQPVASVPEETVSWPTPASPVPPAQLPPRVAPKIPMPPRVPPRFNLPPRRKP